MQRHALTLGLTIMVLVAGGVQAAELGEKAAPLSISKWVKGEPVDVTKADGKHVYVVEFWATWCGPCRTSIPHLTELQKKYKDKDVIFVGVSDEKADVVEEFVKRQGDKMDYRVAIDDNRKTNKGYMMAYKQQGIPTAFIVDQKGKVVWHDHPMGDLESVLDLVVAGKFDDDGRKKLMAQREAEAKVANEAMEAIGNYATGLMEGKEPQELRPHAEKFIKLAGDNADLLNQVAWELLTSKEFKTHDYPLLERMAKQAVTASGGKDSNVLDTYAVALHKNGKTDEAIEVQRKAIQLEENPELRRLLKDRLAEFMNES
jgi:thiol-disulfide isomerase/thioredoxin